MLWLKQRHAFQLVGVLQIIAHDNCDRICDRVCNHNLFTLIIERSTSLRDINMKFLVLANNK